MPTLQPATPAAIWKRVVAGVIDFVVTWLILWPPIFPLFFGDLDVEIEFQRRALGGSFGVVLLLFLLGLWLVPFGLRDLIGGRSFGKWLMGLRVVDAEDAASKPSWRRLLLRNATIWFAPMGLTWGAFHPDRQRFGDRLARTMVVEDPVAPAGPSWRSTMLKAAVFVLVVAGLFRFHQVLLRGYYERSRATAEAAAFVNGCTPLAELTPGLTTGDLTLRSVHYFPTDNGAQARFTWSRETPGMKLSLLAVMDRPVENLTAWRGLAARKVFEPGAAAGNVTHSALNDAALGFLRGYEPLHTAIRDLDPGKIPLVAAAVFREGDVMKAQLAYVRAPDGWEARFQVELRPKDGAWEVSDAGGSVDMNLDNAPARRTYLFLKSAGVHRYLTAVELGQLQQGRALTEVLPEMRPPADNATGAKPGN